MAASKKKIWYNIGHERRKTMGALFEFTGVVKKINEVQRFESGFEKRELVLTDDVGVQVNYPNLLCFIFKKERISLLEGLRPGQRVKVVFAIDGREWSDSSGRVRYFTDLTGLKLEVLTAEKNQTAAQVQPPPPEPETVADDIPF